MGRYWPHSFREDQQALVRLLALFSDFHSFAGSPDPGISGTLPWTGCFGHFARSTLPRGHGVCPS
jgi:hypothetical protein